MSEDHKPVKAGYLTEGGWAESKYAPKSDTIGQAIDALNAGVAMVNAASERMKALGLTPNISINGQDYGDKIAVRLDGDLVR